MSICNFRCSYCYLAQRERYYEGIQPEMKYTPEQVAKALTVERIGGKAYMNFCADGETLLTKDIDQYIYALVKEGHYAEIVTNMTVTPVIDKILSWDAELLKQIEFKCSFHYLELKEKGLLEKFAENVNKVWRAGASANIEITPSDELVPYIEEVKNFSMKHFGALPQLSIARNDRTKEIAYLTSMPMDNYDKIWSQFDSDFWKFKKTIFGKKQTAYCYAGMWSYYVDLTTGIAFQCYCGRIIGNLFEDPTKPLPNAPIGHCRIAHCYNGHMLLTLGLIPKEIQTRYGDIRDRTKIDGTHWLQPQLKAFFNTRCFENNEQLSPFGKFKNNCADIICRTFQKAGRFVGKFRCLFWVCCIVVLELEQIFVGGYDLALKNHYAAKHKWQTSIF